MAVAVEQMGWVSLPRRRKRGGCLGHQMLGQISNRFCMLFVQTFKTNVTDGEGNKWRDWSRGSDRREPLPPDTRQKGGGGERGAEVCAWQTLPRVLCLPHEWDLPDPSCMLCERLWSRAEWELYSREGQGPSSRKRLSLLSKGAQEHPIFPLEHKGFVSICRAYGLYLRCLEGARVTVRGPKQLLTSDGSIVSSHPALRIPVCWAQWAHRRCGHPSPGLHWTSV